MNIENNEIANALKLRVDKILRKYIWGNIKYDDTYRTKVNVVITQVSYVKRDLRCVVNRIEKLDFYNEMTREDKISFLNYVFSPIVDTSYDLHDWFVSKYMVDFEFSTKKRLSYLIVDIIPEDIRFSVNFLCDSLIKAPFESIVEFNYFWKGAEFKLV